MFTDNILSSQVVFSAYLDPMRGPHDKLLDYERGGIALNDPSQGLLVQMWTLTGVENEDGDVEVRISAETVAETVVFAEPGITEVALAFDQNMRPAIAYVQYGTAYLYWFDSTIPGNTVTALPSDTITPRLCTDEKRQFNIANSDVVLSYIRNGNLYFRLQRDRYEDEYLLYDGDSNQPGLGDEAELVSIGMNKGLRLQWRVFNSGSGSTLPYLADVVSDLLRRDKIKPQNIDVSELYETILGYKVAVEAGAADLIVPLQSVFFFDVGEWDEKIRFVKRGGEVVVRVPFEDLAEKEQADIEKTRVQEAELLRKVSVSSIDPAADYAPTTQFAERRSQTINAQAESVVEAPLTLEQSDAAKVAAKRLKISWAELQRLKFCLTTRWSLLTPTDIIDLVARDGTVYTIRLSEIQEDAGELEIDASQNSAFAYEDVEGTTGTSYQAPDSTAPGIIGDTTLLVINAPVMSASHDEIGLYLVVLGDGAGWRGADIKGSVDGGVTEFDVTSIGVSGIVGETSSALAAEISSEYLSNQTLTVSLPEAPASVSYETLLRYANRAAIQRGDGSWEILQYQTVVTLTATSFELSGLVRGRYATAPNAIASGANFALIDSSVAFAAFERDFVSETLSFRAVSIGGSEAGVPWETPNTTPYMSQTEFPVHDVEATRDMSDNVTVTWIGRARLGSETAPFHSKYFDGYRVDFDDGFTVDTTAQTYTRASTPAGVTVTVAAINELTGAGPASEGILI